ncbi:MAG TPA: radical SAM family heme chaperone HemW [Mobilitalea sp.]|nr:radical SAM family heme chaperone HemW [Mobilitalea sp.]
MNDNNVNKRSVDKHANLRDLGLYIHIPFCVKKCEYCDFLSAPADQETKRLYIEALLTEIRSYEGRTGEYIVPSIFIGGGTPSSIDESFIADIMEAINEVFIIDQERLEATIEVNPGTLTKDKLETYLKSGLNRLSFGLQSTDNEELKLLGRIHTFEQFMQNFTLAREVGFHNINIDLMSALPGQTLSSWEKTLSDVIKLNPEHISAYSLIIEEGTPFYDRYQPDSIGYRDLPDEDVDRRMYRRTKEILRKNGYQRYEISNYAKKGFESRHNSSYWTGMEYLGLGLGASSLLDGARTKNMHDIKQYICKCKLYKSNLMERINPSDIKRQITGNEKPDTILKDCIGLREEQEHLTKEDQMEEYMFLGLRMCCGISIPAFCERFGIEINAVYGDAISRLVKDGLLVTLDDRIALTDYGIDVSNVVLSEFLLD